MINATSAVSSWLNLIVDIRAFNWLRRLVLNNMLYVECDIKPCLLTVCLLLIVIFMSVVFSSFALSGCGCLLHKC